MPIGIVSPLPQKNALQGAFGDFKKATSGVTQNLIGSLTRGIGRALSGRNIVSPLPDKPTYRVIFKDKPSVAAATPAPTATPTPTPAPFEFSFPRPSLTPQQQQFANELTEAGRGVGLEIPSTTAAIVQNEASLRRNPPPNLDGERTFGFAGINIAPGANTNITQQEAEDPEFATNFLVNKLATAQRLFPKSLDKQILFYNTQGLAYMDPNNLPYEAAWYLAKALSFMRKAPSPEYRPVLRNFGLIE